MSVRTARVCGIWSVALSPSALAFLARSVEAAAIQAEVQAEAAKQT